MTRKKTKKQTIDDIIFEHLSLMIKDVLDYSVKKKDYFNDKDKLERLLMVTNFYNSIASENKSQKTVHSLNETVLKLRYGLLKEVQLLLKYKDIPLNDLMGLVDLKHKLLNVPATNKKDANLIIN